ncbi:hypothetical protein [Bradyrhizobium acaciae]|uniref:hypothetical protein n=1 Tax=Bradyrhizobium acaciae TaxID=2683706 RepID=UPI001E50D0F9|nr:hypothetical protein [Bradyrhizobium acaciae]MCC8978897.1 hypothetical protein [Bradyrhizobium acaciae]
MTSRSLTLFERAKSTALTTRTSIEETRNTIEQERETTRRESEELASTHVNLIFALDATASRERFWEESKLIQSTMFSAVGTSGLKVRTQLVSYSGLTQLGDVAAGDWHSDAEALSDTMENINCVAGHTQIGQVFKHAVRENTQRKVHGLILIGDSCEEDGAQLRALGSELNENRIQLYIMDDGNRSDGRHPDTFRIFRETAEAAEGVYLPLESKSIAKLIDYLRVAAVASSGNIKAVDRIAGSVTTAEGRAFLEQRKKYLLLSHDKK